MLSPKLAMMYAHNCVMFRFLHIKRISNYQVILSAPAENESGTGSSTKTPTPLTQPCEYDTCATGSPAEGFNQSDRK